MASAQQGTKKQDPLSITTIRNLNDKLYEKRKLGALEVEQLIKDLNRQQDSNKIMEVITYLHENFIKSTSVSSRKGGLIAIAAAALGLGQDIGRYISHIVPPVMQCFVDNDNKVRYYACESFYNIAKAARGLVLQFFNELFDDLCKLAADPDVHVRSAADVLDGLVKDIVTEGNRFDVSAFIPMLARRVYVTNTECRKFLISWIVLLDSVPDIELVHYLPQFLDGIILMLSDPSEEIRNVVSAAMGEFLAQIRKNSNRVDFGSLIKIIIPHSSTNDPYNFITRQTIVQWIHEFISIGADQILPYAHLLLSGILPCVEEVARLANKKLLELVKETKEAVNVKQLLDVIQAQFNNQRVPTRLSALRWVLTLYQKSPAELQKYLDELFPSLLKILSDPAEEVVRVDLQVLAKLSANEEYFDKLMKSLVTLFRTDRKLLDHRGNLIIRQLSIYTKPEKIFKALALILEPEDDTDFASTMIQTLNLILLTSTELADVRSALKNLLTNANPDTEQLFVTLYKSWCHNPTAVFSLCLLAQVYEHAYNLVTKCADIEVTVSFLIEIDKLVQLLESPIFMFLRLQLLEPDRHPYLFKALYGLLMLLPQSSAFETLRNRLNCVTSLGVLQLMPKSGDVLTPPKSINFDELLKHFVTVQAKHTQQLRKARLEAEKAESATVRANKTLTSGSGANGSETSVPSTPLVQGLAQVDAKSQEESTTAKVQSPAPKAKLTFTD